MHVEFKLNNIDDHTEWITEFIKLQLPDGRWTNGYNSFFIEDTELFEFSTQHFDEDSHRIIKGD